jgi:hypothetical protein
MKRLSLLAAGLLALALPSATPADAQVRIRLGFPAVLPPLVQVEPGVRVVQDYDEEIFFTRGYYWVQHDGSWYRARDHRGTWYLVRPGRLPPQLVRHEPGRYRRWQHDDHRSWPDARRAPRGARHWRENQWREDHDGGRGGGRSDRP